MKSLAIIIAGTACLAFSSCKKEYICTCTSNNDGNVVSSSTGKNTNEKAKENCNRIQAESKSLVPVTCTVD